MKITEKELLFLAAMGACHESTFCEDHKDFGKAKRFNEIMKALIEAKSLADLVDNLTRRDPDGNRAKRPIGRREKPEHIKEEQL